MMMASIKLEKMKSLGNKFAPFIKLKRENAILKAQLKDLMLTQKNAWKC